MDSFIAYNPALDEHDSGSGSSDASESTQSSNQVRTSDLVNRRPSGDLLSTIDDVMYFDPDLAAFFKQDEERQRSWRKMCHIIELRPGSNLSSIKTWKMWPDSSAAARRITPWDFQTAQDGDPSIQPIARFQWRPVLTLDNFHGAAGAEGRDGRRGPRHAQRPRQPAISTQAASPSPTPSSPEPSSPPEKAIKSQATIQPPMAKEQNNIFMSAPAPPSGPQGPNLSSGASAPLPPAAAVQGGPAPVPGPPGPPQSSQVVEHAPVQHADPTNFIFKNGLVYFRPPLQTNLDGSHPDLNIPSNVPLLAIAADALDTTWLYHPRVWHNCAADLVKAHPPPILADCTPETRHYVDRYRHDNLMLFTASTTFECPFPAWPPPPGFVNDGVHPLPRQRFSAFGINWGPITQRNESSVACPILTEGETMCALLKATIMALKIIDWRVYGYSCVTVVSDSLRLFALVTHKQRFAMVTGAEANLLRELWTEIAILEQRGLAVKFWKVETDEVTATRRLAEDGWVPRNWPKEGLRIIADWEFALGGYRFKWTGTKWQREVEQCGANLRNLAIAAAAAAVETGPVPHHPHQEFQFVYENNFQEGPQDANPGPSTGNH
ncbi:hypothetical protein Dda_1190 [Drechslerella dactyloides]|uniref:Uncharacterized protein n=1 Tax=Drechslerella dactyloides TaxID=74499 RepID=A0AAD6J7G7_DREDA|nr:hypothetical protein Dda_1190 [Drechslerella dactyloides]